eukprot:COSAG02_NODE_3403_length_6798_cov_63.887744_7_plen_64_part_00
MCVILLQNKQMCHCTYLPVPFLSCTYLHDSTWALGRFWRFLSLEVGVLRYANTIDVQLYPLAE